ncbi:MAG: transglutaminase domain-containing protein [Pseudonocardiales bacterium]|nr:transglutaminase domain-containing protein [Pseudonocardiales bacterium]
MTGWADRTLPAGVAAVAGAAGLALALAATSLTEVLAGLRWWSCLVLSIAVVVAAGVLLRWLRMPPIVTAAGQLAALMALVTAVFTTSGWLLVVPGPASRAQLGGVLAGAAEQIRVGLPPLPESTELHCLVVVAVGLVAVVVDLLAVSLAAPACAGLVLLCMIIVPTVVSDRMLPWWTFALSAVGFALLLAADTQRRQRTWGDPVISGRVGYARPVITAGAVTAGAVAVALFIGTTATAVGTGRATRTHVQGPAIGIGLNPFTSLRGQLSTEQAVPLLRVHGLGQRAYLRALTLSQFVNGVGWQQGPLDPAVPAGDEATERLPLPAGVVTPVSGSTLEVQIVPINYADSWLPSFGYPLALGGISPSWRYDPNAITVFSDRRQRAEPYTELGVLPRADPQLLRAAGPVGGAAFAAADPRYLDTGGVDRRVVKLAARVTAGTPTAFDAAVALNRWFTEPSNGFRYDLRTTAGTSGDALVDFLFTGHRGYCEQFASAMAIMLRTQHVPARVAVGFTPGTVIGDARLITTEDAHAWVEAWFPGAGWLPFDPTPLSGARTVPPAYATGPSPPSGLALPPRPPPVTVPATASSHPLAAAGPRSLPTRSTSGATVRLGLTVTGLLGFGVLMGLVPLGVREGRRRWRMHLVGAGGPRAVSAAWQELLAESADRRVVPPVGETVRATARRLVDEHGLDDAGQAGLRILVDAVERTWYASAPTAAGGRRRGGRGPRSMNRELRIAMNAVLTSMVQSAPLTRTARLLPRSVLWRPRGRYRGAG